MSKLRLNILLSLALICGLNIASFGQVIDSVIIDGKQFYVYPFRVDVLSESEYQMAKHVNKRNKLQAATFTDFKEYYSDESDEVITRKQYRSFRKLVRSYSKSDIYRDDQKHLNKKFFNAVRANPYPLLQQRFFANSDLTPILDPIPDGDYVQYYSDFCLIDKKGNCKNNGSLVAGHFSFKNNLLNGEATWIDLAGDTLKHGVFKNGLREGLWIFETRKAPYSISKEIAEKYIEFGTIELDTLREMITYLEGAKNGKYTKFRNSEFPIETGYYTNGEQSGEWIYREVNSNIVNLISVPNRHNYLVTHRLTHESDDNLIVDQKWIRSGLIETYSANYAQFNFFPEYEIIPPKLNLYTINFEREPNFELEEEVNYEIYMDGYEYYIDEYDYSVSQYQTQQFDPRLNEYKNRGLLMDSIGGKPNYTGVLESYYPNGNLAYRYEFVNGMLLKEDTIFWDNGVAHDVITEIPDSNQFLRSIYDYSGLVYMELIYDSRMDFVRSNVYQVYDPEIIDGLEVTLAAYSEYFYYSNFDTLEYELEKPLLLYKSWYAGDYTMMYSTNYDPDSRALKYIGIAALGNTVYTDTRTFSENFDSWTGKKSTYLADLELIQTSSGSLYEWITPDTIPQRNVSSSFEIFDVASEFKLKKNGEFYTGDVSINFNKSKLSIGKNDLVINLPKDKSIEKKLIKDLEKYRQTGKTQYPLILSLIDVSDTKIDISSYFNIVFTEGPLGKHFTDYSRDYYEYEMTSLSNQATSKIVGYMLDGKPQGLWVSYDEDGQKILEMTYNKGEADGEKITYSYAFPREKSKSIFDFSYDTDEFLTDSIPEKKTHYVSKIEHYSHGKQHGEEVTFNWYGEELNRSNYVDGFLDGKSVQRNKLAHSIMNYSNGRLDGYYQTYLTIPNRDSVLLFDLNFQDDLLQGESKSYHINGQLAKRGFFLDGAPIEDYEAYDTLGFKYHYVKFKYSFPIEEKIWEENELSVRYQFNWEDSISFQPSDITTSQSLESTLYQLGLGQNQLSQPYYGRPSLVNKLGVTYRLTKYFPNDTISREGEMVGEQKSGCWKHFSYDGNLLYEVEYHDSIIELNDSIIFKSKGILSDFDINGNLLHTSFIIEKFSKYDCAHSDHYEVRQLYTIWEAIDTLNRMNGYTQNFYDNGTLQSEGKMKDGLPEGIWKLYDPFGKLNHYGLYVQGKRDGRWLSGDLSKTKYLGDICLNPNLPDLAEEIKYRENLLDITITNYHLGKSLNKQYYDIDMNRFYDEQETKD